MLGGFRVEVRGQELPDAAWQRRKARQLFKCLLIRRGRRLLKDEIAELFWPDSDEEATSTNLRSAVHAVRVAFRSVAPDLERDLLIVDRDSLYLDPRADLWVDADAFERVVAEAQRAPDPLPLLKQAQALYRGDLLPEDVYEDWAADRRAVLRRAWIDLQFALAVLHGQRDELEAAAAALQPLLEADPCDERAAQELMRLLLRQERRSEALRVYQQLAEALQDDLGVEPSAATIELGRQVRSPSVAPAPPSPAFQCVYPFPAPEELVGRAAELARLDRLLERGRAGGQAVLIGAPSGTGKSALVGTLVRRAQGAGVLCLAGGCYAERGILPLGPFHDALADYLLANPADPSRIQLCTAVVDLVAVVPELRSKFTLAEVATAELTTERMRLFDAVLAALRTLAEHGPLLLCLEDLHGADAATLHLLHYIVRQTRRLRLVIVGTFRSDEAPSGGPLTQVVTALARERLAELASLAPLDREQTGQLTTVVLGGPSSSTLDDLLYQTTGGNPLFLEQFVLALRDQGRLEQRGGVWHAEAESVGAPPVIRELVDQRLTRLDPRIRETLESAAVLGQTFDYGALLAMVSPTEESVLLADLDQAISAHLLREASAGFAFGHALLREGVYWAMSAPRRMLLHRRAAETLERLAGEHAAERAAEMAHHFAQAGHAPHVRAKALHYSLEAGRRAAALSSHREALHHYGKACELIEHAGLEVEQGTRVIALEGRGYAERDMGMWPACISTFQRVMQLSDHPLNRARARGVIANALHHVGNTKLALYEADAGLSELQAIQGNTEARLIELQLHFQQALFHYLEGRFAEVHALGERMLPIAADLAQPDALFCAHSVLAWARMGQGQVSDALEHYTAALQSVSSAEHKIETAMALANIGIESYLGGRLRAAREHLERAATLFRDSAGELRVVNTLQHLGRVCLAEGDLEQARKHADTALLLATEANERWAADCHDLLGIIDAVRCEWERAEASFEEALRVRTQVHFAAGVVESTIGLGLVHQYRGNWGRARDLFAGAVAVAARMDPCPQAVAALRQLGKLEILQGDLSAATEQIQRGLALAEATRETLEYGPMLLVAAELYACLGNLGRAHDLARRALEATRTAEQLIEVHLVLASLELAAGRPEAAREHTTEAARQAESLGAPRLLSLAHLAGGRVAAAQGDLGRALPRCATALKWAEDARAPYERAQVLRVFARCLVVQSADAGRARTMLDKADSLLRQLGAGSAAGQVEGPAAAEPLRTSTLAR